MTSRPTVFRPSIRSLSFMDCILSGITVGFGESVSATYLSKTISDPHTLAFLLSAPLAIAALFQLVWPRVSRNISAKQSALIFSLLQGFALLCMASALRDTAINTIYMFSGLTLYWFAALNTAAALQELYSCIVPTQDHGKFFSQRQMISSFLTLGCFFATGFFLGRGFAQETIENLFLVSAVARFSASMLLSFLPNIQRRLQVVHHPAHTKNSHSDVSLFAVCCLAFLFRTAANTSSVFYLKWLLTDLSFPLTTYSLMIAIPLVVRVISCSNWGKMIDQNKLWDALVVATVLVSITPAWSAISGSPIAVGFTQFFSGLGWAGFELITLLLIQRMFPNRVMEATGYFLGAGYLGTVAGSWIGAEMVQNGLNYQSLFLISALSRSIMGYTLLYYYRRKKLFHFKDLQIKYSVWSLLSLYPTIQMASKVLLIRTRHKHVLAKRTHLDNIPMTVESRRSSVGRAADS